MKPVSDFLSVAAECRPDPRYVPRAALYLFKIAAFEPFRWVERARSRLDTSDQVLERPPVFILGYYRSGTTHLQQTLLADDQFGYMNFYQGFFPTAFNVTGPWVQPVFESIITRTGFLHPAHKIPFSFKLPAEEDVALVASGYRLASNWGQVYQKHFKRLYGRTALLEDASEEELHDFQLALHDLIWRVSKANAHRRLLLKSPPHTGRLRMLHAMYPNARFIFIRRHPHEVFSSNLGLWKSFDDNRLQAVSPEVARDYILWSHDRAHENYEVDKHALRPGQLVEVTFEDLVDQPMEVLQTIYETLDLGDFDALGPRFERYLADHHETPAPHTLSESDRTLVNTRLDRWFDAWGYDR